MWHNCSDREEFFEEYYDRVCIDFIHNPYIKLIERKEWKTIDGRVLKIADMDDCHLINTIKMIAGIGGRMSKKYISLMSKELSNRGLSVDLEL